MISSYNKEAVSSKKNLFVKEFNLEEANMLIDSQMNQIPDKNLLNDNVLEVPLNENNQTATNTNRKIVMTAEDLDASEES